MTYLEKALPEIAGLFSFSTPTTAPLFIFLKFIKSHFDRLAGNHLLQSAEAD